MEDKAKGKRLSVKFIKPIKKMWIVSPYWGFIEPLDAIAVSFYESGLPETCYIDKYGDTYFKIDEHDNESYIVESIEINSQIFKSLVHCKIDSSLSYSYFDKLLKSEKSDHEIQYKDADDLYRKSPELYDKLSEKIKQDLIADFYRQEIPFEQCLNFE